MITPKVKSWVFFFEARGSTRTGYFAISFIWWFRLCLTAFYLLVGVGSSFLFSFVRWVVGLFYGVLWFWWDVGVFELLAVLVVGMRLGMRRFEGIDRSGENELNGNLLRGSLIYLSVSAYLDGLNGCDVKIDYIWSLIMLVWIAFVISILWELLFRSEEFPFSRVFYRTSMLWLLLDIVFGDEWDEYVEKRERKKAKRKIAKSKEA